ncbi:MULTISPECIES: hypothetical protein [Streptomyces]|uniref:SMODS and SLOG-associating 2TM effector domain-containing protein n=1 Tax=Streptomyces fimbriatus TaxID=68197 RepID=A0ABW0D3J3_STRFI
MTRTIPDPDRMINGDFENAPRSLAHGTRSVSRAGPGEGLKGSPRGIISAKGGGAVSEGACERDVIGEVIGLRMKEYESLRSEVVQRIGARQQLAGYAGAATAIAATLGSDLGLWRIFIVGAVLGVAYFYLRDSNDGIQRLGEHLRLIEKEVNSLARDAYGHDVLSWESHRQIGRNGEKRIWKLIGRFGGWHRDDPRVTVPGPR